MSQQTTLNLTSLEADGPVECLGHTFPSDAERREHYLRLLAEKLRDPEFRKIEGFPIGEDEDILALSDPPYYTACPNPWIGEFITYYGRTYDPKEPYHREPLAIDVSVGKTDALYKAHGYHTKVPHLAIVPSILHYTEPGDVVLDGFAGSGMTGVAAQWCAMAPASYRQEIEMACKAAGRPVPRWGARRAVLNDLSPAATFITANYNIPFDVGAFAHAGKQLLDELEQEIGWMYETLHSDGTTKGRIEYMVWSEVFSCPECAGEVNFLDEALDESSKRVRDAFPCPHCNAELTKKKLERLHIAKLDSATGSKLSAPKRVPSLISYRIDKIRYEKKPDAEDLALLHRIEDLPLPADVPLVAFPFADMWEATRVRAKGITHTHHMFLPRAALAMGTLWEKARANPNIRIRLFLMFFVEQAIWGMSLLARYAPTHFSQVNQYLAGVYYIGSQHAECSPWYILTGKLARLIKAFNDFKVSDGGTAVNTGTAARLPLEDASIDYIFTDPPFGENLPYAELNFLVEAWHGVQTQAKLDAIVDRSKENRAAQKSVDDYRGLMADCFKEYFRALKPGRWMTVVFSNTQAAVWNSLQTAMQEAGFVVANVSALDKQQGSFKAVTTTVAVKQDLVISAYKPNGGLEERFKKTGHTPEGVWDFMKTHLRNLPVVKPRGGELEFIAERDPRILYDRMVAFYFGHGVPVPLSSAEFQAGLAEKFPEREGMAFLAEQVAEFDKKRAQMQGVGQMSIFVEDEKSAIDWLRNFLKSRPSLTSDITPDFMQQLGASWKKFETRPELSLLLEQNFLRYDGQGEVPSQIHSYLSTQNKDLRNLPKDDARLRSRSKDRWYVPDPAKAVDVESIRNKRLLLEFRQLCDEAGVQLPSPGVTNQPQLPLVLPAAKKTARKKLKEVRTEAVRLGFKQCFAAKDYTTILALAAHLPNNVIEEDEQLQMIFDMAEMRAGG